MYIYMYIYIYIYMYIYIYSVPQEDRKVFSGCYILKTDGKILTRHPENRRENFDGNFGEKFPDENLANMGDPRTHAESTDRWGGTEDRKVEMKKLIPQSIHPESTSSLGIFTKVGENHLDPATHLPGSRSRARGWLDPGDFHLLLWISPSYL